MTTAVQDAPAVQRKSKSWWRPVALLAAVVAVLVLAKALGLDQALGNLRDWIQSIGAWGPVVFVLLYVAATVAAVPGSALTIAAGALFGTVLGTIVVSVASTAGAALCFLVARYFARNAVTEWIGGSERFRRLDALTETHGETIVAVTRLIPLFPFNLLNYGFGLTRVRFWTYVLYSWMCMLPMTIIFVAGTDAAAKFFTEGKIEVSVIVAIALMIVVLAVVIRSARRKLRAGGTPVNAPATGEGETSHE